MNTELLPAHLRHLGDALHAAASDDLARETGTERTTNAPRRATARGPRFRGMSRRRAALGVVAAAILIPGGAVAAASLISGPVVAASMPAGTLALMGTEPTCTVVRPGIEFSCTLAKAPTGDIGAGNWLKTVEPTVDATKHVNGGCRSHNADGTKWSCYIGQAAVREQIIGPALLGQLSAGPGVG